MEDKERLLVELQKKVTSLERRLQGNLSQDEHLQELLQEVKNKSWVYFMTVAHGWQLTCSLRCCCVSWAHRCLYSQAS